MKLILLSILFLFICFSCGSTGRVMFYDFNASKYKVEKEILSIINNGPNHTLPPKWIGGTKGDYLEYFYIYFKNNPEEMYQIGFKYDSLTWNESSNCSLAIVSQFSGEEWKYEKDLSNNEIDRITKRFEDVILSKLSYGYIKKK